jgi:hypothetical protein
MISSPARRKTDLRDGRKEKIEFRRKSKSSEDGRMSELFLVVCWREVKKES